MELYSKKTKTGWKPPDKKRKSSPGWTYYENGEVKPPGTDAFRLLKGAYRNIKDNPITQSIVNELNKSAELIGEAQLVRAEANIEASKATGDVIASPIKAAQNVLNYSSGQTYHPNCLETFGELCTVNEYNKKMSDRITKNALELLHKHNRDEGEVDVDY